MQWYEATDEGNLIDLMKESKGAHMFEYLQKNYDTLSALKDSIIAKPLHKCVERALMK